MAGESLAVLVVRLFYNFLHVVFDTRVPHNATVHLHSFIISSPKHQQLNPVHQKELISAVTFLCMYILQNFHWITYNYSAVDVLSKYLYLIIPMLNLEHFWGL